MSSLVDLAIATGLFFVFVALILSFVLNYYSNFQGILQDSELRTSAANLNNVFFGGKGVPTDWETRSATPARIGLLNDLYRLPVILTTTNGSDFNNATVNFTLTFDPNCLNTTREKTIRIFNETDVEHQYTLYNRTFCVANTFLKSADFALNVTLPGARPKVFFVYFSPESGVNATVYGTYGFPIYPGGISNVSNYTVIKYPTETLSQVSPSKLNALRNLTISQVLDTIGSNTNFRLEVDRP